MKGVAKIALSVALIVIVVLSIVVASVAWFTSNPEVTADDVTLNAARTLTVSFDSTVNGTDYKYNGQIGNVYSNDRNDPDPDEPYVYEAGYFNVNVNSLSGAGRAAKIKIGFGTVEIAHPTGTISDVLITDLFHVTANVYKENSSAVNKYVKDPTHGHFRPYNGETDSALTIYEKVIDATIADNGVLRNGNTDATFIEGTYALSFTFVFLPESAYAVWEDAVAGRNGATFYDIYGYERYASGDYVGVMEYTAYKAKYHYGLQRYKMENGHYTPDENGGFVRIVTRYANENITKYAVTYVPDANGTHYKLDDNNFVKRESATEAEKGNGTLCNITPTSGSGGYILVGEDYMQYLSYRQRNGFPYSDDKYRGEKFTFDVNCSVEEV